MLPQLSEDEEAQLIELIDSAIQETPLRNPAPAESEPTYTARVLMPIAKGVIQRVGLDGVTLAGEQSTRVAPTYFLGHSFFPDMGVSYFARRLVAYEVKFLREQGRPNALSTALGQCLLYQLERYSYVRAILIDHLSTPRADLDHCDRLLSRAEGRIRVIHRTIR